MLVEYDLEKLFFQSLSEKAVVVGRKSETRAVANQLRLDLHELLSLLVQAKLKLLEKIVSHEHVSFESVSNHEDWVTISYARERR